VSSSIDRTSAYAKAVLDGEIVAGPHVRASCKRHFKDLKEAEARGIYFDHDAAERVFRFFEDILKLNGGKFEGLPFKLHPSQCFKLGSLFGWKRLDGTRRFRRGYIEEGKGNGKSPLAAGIGLYGLIADNEARAEIYAAAAKRDQAMIMFRDARAMVQLSPLLEKRCLVSGGDHQPNIAFHERGSFFRPLSSDKAQSGTRPSIGLCDEVHEHPSRDTIDMLERGFKGRVNPLLLMITNSGFDKTTVCWEEHEHAVNVAHGIIDDDTTFSYVCALDEGDEPLENPACWLKANPLLGVTITEDYLAIVAKQARQMPGKRNGILRLHFCVWTDAESAWMARVAWEAVEQELCLDDYKGRECYLGIDLSYTRDLTALAIAFPSDGGTYDAFVEFWTPGDTVRERTDSERVPYDVWVNGGFIHATAGKVIKAEHVAARLGEIMSMFDVRTLAYDRYRQKELEDDLADLGIDVPMVEHPQGFRRVSTSELWMPSSVEKLENAIIEENIRVATNPVMRWNVASTVVRDDPAGTGNRVFDKRKATGRIDGVVALAMALGVSSSSIKNEQSPKIWIL
jgi:phage terminase large subunit-like protein